jgi:hypothetical protein
LSPSAAASGEEALLFVFGKRMDERLNSFRRAMREGEGERERGREGEREG